MMQRPGVILYAEFFDTMYNLDDCACACIVRAVGDYGLNGIEPDPDEFSDVAAIVWPMIRAMLDRGQVQYDKVCWEKTKNGYTPQWRQYAAINGLDENDRKLKEAWVISQQKAKGRYIPDEYKEN